MINLQRNVENELLRLAADSESEPIFGISLQAKSKDELLTILKDTTMKVSTTKLSCRKHCGNLNQIFQRGYFAEAIFLELSRNSQNVT